MSPDGKERRQGARRVSQLQAGLLQLHRETAREVRGAGAGGKRKA